MVQQTLKRRGEGPKLGGHKVVGGGGLETAPKVYQPGEKADGHQSSRG